MLGGKTVVCDSAQDPIWSVCSRKDTDVHQQGCTVFSVSTSIGSCPSGPQLHGCSEWGVVLCAVSRGPAGSALAPFETREQLPPR